MQRNIICVKVGIPVLILNKAWVRVPTKSFDGSIHVGPPHTFSSLPFILSRQVASFPMFLTQESLSYLEHWLCSLQFVAEFNKVHFVSFIALEIF